MQVTDATNLAEVIGVFTGPVVLGFVIVLLLRGDLVTKGQNKELERDRDTWQEIAMEAINLSMAAIARRETNHGEG